MEQNTNTPDVRRGQTSASNAPADAACAARFLMQKKALAAGVKESERPDALRGDRIHAALAELPSSQGGPSQLLMQTLPVEEREIYDACVKIRTKLILGYFGELKDSNYREFRHERYWVKFGANGQTFEHSGEVDFAARVGTKALIVDYKTGHNEAPESPRNLQLRDLACLLRGNLIPTNEIAVAIIQPLVTHDPEICLYGRPELERATKEMFDRIVKSHLPDQTPVAGEPQCTHCLAKGLCVQYQKWAGQITPPAMLTVLEVPMSSWTPEQCAVAAGALAPADKLLGEIKAMLKARLEADPASVPGWMLQPGSIREKITDPQTVFDRFVKLGGKLEQFMGCVAVGKGDLKEAVNTVTGAKGKNLDAAIKTLVDGCVQQSQTAPSLKRKDPEPERAP